MKFFSSDWWRSLFNRTNPQPFAPLSAARNIERLNLPEDLAEFYRHNEGVGLESDPERLIRLCQLAEVEQIGWSDLHVIGEDSLEGWEHFSGYRIGISSFFDEIVYVLNAPTCPPGSILLLGVDICGPGGDGPLAFECSLVLATNFQEWLNRLERSKWIDLGLIPGEFEHLPASEQGEVSRYFKSLNPQITWAG